MDVTLYDPPFDEWQNARRLPSETSFAFTNWQNRTSVERILGRPRFELVWHFKDGRWVSHTGPRLTHELILLYGETVEAYLGQPNNGKPQNKGRGCVGKDKLPDRVYTPRARKQLNSVLEYPRNVNSGMGCWGKPLKLVSLLLEWSGGKSVLDPYMGGGTTLVAAKELGLRAVGIEIDEKICEFAANRLRQGLLEFE